MTMTTKAVHLLICCGLLSAASPESRAEDAPQDAADVVELEGATLGRMGAPAADEDVEFSEAETVLWMTDQLENIDHPTRLQYAFERSGAMGDDFTDSVELDVTRIYDDGMKSARVRFLSGERNQYVPPNERTNGNPVLAIYLQGDVHEMNRLTSGNWRYFHRRIKTAFAENAEVGDVSVAYGDRQVPAKRVYITPYVDDPKRPQFEEYADKSYEIIVSNDIPGYLYSVRTVIPGRAQPGEQPLLEERLVLKGVSDLE